ncbi:MAG: response regulator transcription factor [Firmicutes bacterium]|nr:response regulator transcription factor [Bacillota bacterium]MDY2920641.1 response regulator transcription factor [Lentihominibacter sp.]
MYISIGFLTYVLASFVALLGIGLLVLLISKSENRKSKLYRAVICFCIVIFAYCGMYFMLYFRDMVLHYYEVNMPLRCIDYLLDGAVTFFWLRTIGCIFEKHEGRSMKHITAWAWICGAARTGTGVISAIFLLDEYYALRYPSITGAYLTAEFIIVTITSLIIARYSIEGLRASLSRNSKIYIGVVSSLLVLWEIIQNIVDTGLYTGRYISAWGMGFFDTTSPTVFIIGMASFVYVFREDFSPLYYPEKSSPSGGLEEMDPVERAAIQHRLTARELDVMRLVYEGKNNPEIAEALYISRNTVKKHLQNIYEKTGVSSRMELVYVINREGPPLHR